MKNPPSMQQTPTSSVPGTPVSVMQTNANQVQVNITPDAPGRTLISVYHQNHQYPQPGSSASTSSGYSKDTLPQENIPNGPQTNHVPAPQQYSAYQNNNQIQKPGQALYGNPEAYDSKVKHVDKMLVGASELVTAEENYPEEHKIERIENINVTRNQTTEPEFNGNTYGNGENQAFGTTSANEVQEESTQETSVDEFDFKPRAPAPTEVEEDQGGDFNKEKSPIKEEETFEVKEEVEEQEEIPPEINEPQNVEEPHMEPNGVPEEVPEVPPEPVVEEEQEEEEEEEEEEAVPPEPQEIKEENKSPEIAEFPEPIEAEESEIEEPQPELEPEPEPEPELEPEPEPEPVMEEEPKVEPVPEKVTTAPAPVQVPISIEPVSESSSLGTTPISFQNIQSEATSEATPAPEMDAEDDSMATEDVMEASPEEESSKKKKTPAKPRGRKSVTTKKTPAPKQRKRKKDSDFEDDEDEDFAISTKR